MAVVVEDGSKVASANSYVSDAEFTTYIAARGYTLIGSSSVLLIRAKDYLETLNYIGEKASKEQPLLWPRVTSLGNLGGYSFFENGGLGLQVDGYAISSTEIPTRLKNAQMEIAYQLDQGFDATATTTQTVISEKIGPIETKYAQGSSQEPYYQIAHSYLSPLLKAGGSVRVRRG